MSGMRYEFRVAGRLSERAQQAFEELTAVEVPTETVLYGTLVDDAQVHGVLARLQDLGLRVVSMQQVHERDGEEVTGP
ncbi:hypothetical protein GCM10023215_59660 [Pseudonocardia yuanmonensis]|uniref:Uncharacterized protein n=1 Tax=Pseudonocardia yuanmonensis TaxID=1095914 RepID=A0ABP8XP44_9PSEU